MVNSKTLGSDQNFVFADQTLVVSEISGIHGKATFSGFVVKFNVGVINQ